MGMKLGHILQSARPVDIDLGRFRSDELKYAARFWLGKEAGSYKKDKCIAVLTKVMNSGTAYQVPAALSEKEQQVLAIFARYGPTVPGAVLGAEMYARGLVVRPLEGQDHRSYHTQRRNDLVRGLREKFMLIGNPDYYYSSFHDRRYPTLTLHPSLTNAVAPADALPWRTSACDEAVGICRRSSAEVALDLWRVAAALRAMETWPTIKGDSPSKSTRASLRNKVALCGAEQDSLSPPDPESLCYELLHGMDLMDFTARPRWIKQDALEQYCQEPAAAQAWHWVRAWLYMALWQDGIGLVPDRDSDDDSVRIEPSRLYQARELLAWALTRVAHAPACWLDLESFLRDLWQATREDPIDFYWSDYCWDPGFEMARKKEHYPVGEDRTLAFWFDREAVWAANAIMVTLVALGIVERGETVGRKNRPCFRLTELGRAVFGAPEIEAVKKPGDARFITVQPNLEVVAYLDSAEARQVCTLTRFAACASRSGGPVQTFELRRKSIYGALESGMTLDEIRSFLTEHGKTQLPANVERMLSEWAGKRESLVLRTKVVLALGPVETGPRCRAMSAGAHLLPPMTVKKATQDFPGWTVVDHEDKPERTWTANELGGLTSTGGHSISGLRLARIADLTETGWQITQQSVGRARMSGLTADQILGWLGQHLTASVPALLETAVRNWTGRQDVRLGQVRLLQVAQPRARDALLYSAAFRPFLAGHILPEWFVIHDDRLPEVRGLLERLGFTICDSLDLPPAVAAQDPAEAPPAVIYRISNRRRKP
jgi:hypothetical protein